MRRAHVWILILATALGGCGDSATQPIDAAAPDVAVQPPPSDPLVDSLAGRRILWVGAHPDDESTIAPLLGEVCVDQSAICSFLVLTRGERGGCVKPGGCLPDLVTVRTAELAAAAQIYGATVLHGSLPDGSAPDPAGVLAAWTTAAGDQAALLRAVTDAITSARPEVVLMFDPRHGSTCHPDHRAAGALVRAALDTLGAAAPTAYFVEGKLAGTEATAYGYAAAAPDDARVLHYDANRVTAGAAGATWRYLLRNLTAHTSQFTASQLAAFTATPPTLRNVFLLPSSGLAGADPRYDTLCP